MTQRFGGIYSVLSNRDYFTIQKSLNDNPFFFKESIDSLSILEIIEELNNTIDLQKTVLKDPVVGKGKTFEDIRELRERIANLSKIKEKLEKKWEQMNR